MLFIVSPLHFAWFVSGSRRFICCYLVADVIPCTVLLPGFFAISISLRGLPVFSLERFSLDCRKGLVLVLVLVLLRPLVG